MAPIELVQFQGGGGVVVGEFSTGAQQLRLITHLLRFKGPGPARDQPVVRLQQRRVGLLLYAIVSSAAALTVVLTLTVLCFVLVHRRHWLLSGSQDELLLLGLLLSSSSVLVSGLDGASPSDWTFEILCSARLWTLSLGHSVAFAVLLSRTWRVYSVCSIKQRQQTLRRRAGGVLVWVFLLDVLVLIFWQILDPLRRVVLQHSPESDPADQDVIVRPYSECCRSVNMELWLTAVYGYRAPLLGLGCFLAWNIRTAEVGHPAVSSNLLSLSVFAVTVFSVSAASGSLLTSHSPPVQFCVSSVLILCCNLFILVVLFGPKVPYVCSNSGELQAEAAEAEDDEEDELRRLNQQLKSLTAQLDVELETITMQLSEASESETLQGVTGVKHAGIRPVMFWDDRDGPDDINSPEHVCRRLSVQLPILHHSYLPVIGGVTSSHSSLFGSREAFVYHHDNFLYT